MSNQKRQVVENQEKGTLGAIYLEAPGSFAAPIIGLFLIAIGICAFLWTLEFSKRMEVQGILKPSDKSMDVYATAPGIFTTIAVVNGAYVKKGDLLAVIDRDVTLVGGASASGSQVDILKGDLNTIEKINRLSDEKAALIESSAREKRAATERELVNYRNILRGLEATDTKLSAKFEKMKALYRKRLLTRDEMEMIKLERLGNREKITQVRSAIDSIGIKLRNIDLERRNSKSDIDRERAMARTQSSDINFQIKEQLSSKSNEVRSPVSGVIAQLDVAKGDPAVPGRLLLSVLPKNNVLKASLFVPSSVVPYLLEGQNIWLSFQGLAPDKGGLFPGSLKIKKAKLMEPDQMRTFQITVPTYVVEVKFDKKTLKKINQTFPMNDDLPMSSKIPVYRKMLWNWITEPIEKMTELDESNANKRKQK